MTMYYGACLIVHCETQSEMQWTSGWVECMHIQCNRAPLQGFQSIPCLLLDQDNFPRYCLPFDDAQDSRQANLWHLKL